MSKIDLTPIVPDPEVFWSWLASVFYIVVSFGVLVGIHFACQLVSGFAGVAIQGLSSWAVVVMGSLAIGKTWGWL